jgi:hypothetical protein
MENGKISVLVQTYSPIAEVRVIVRDDSFRTSSELPVLVTRARMSVAGREEKSAVNHSQPKCSIGRI